MIGRRYAEVIGDPIAHSKSPLIHNFWLKKLGIDAGYTSVRVQTAELPTYLEERRGQPGWQGANLTIPHKEAVIACLDAIETFAERIGAVNAVFPTPDGRLVGVNTDHVGFAEPLLSSDSKFESAVVLGAGGAARSVVAALLYLGLKHIEIINRDMTRAEKLIADFSWRLGPAEIVASAHFGPADLVVNATSLGMQGQPPLQVDLDHLPAHAVVYDLVYAPLETGLLAKARARGLTTIDGLSMLIGQAAHAFEMFFLQPAPRQHDAELRALLTA